MFRPHSRNRGAQEHCSRDFGAQKQRFLRWNFTRFFKCCKICAFLILCLAKTILAPKFWSNKFWHRLYWQNFYCCFAKLEIFQFLNEKMAKISIIRRNFYAKNRDFPIEKQRFLGVNFTLPRLNFFLLWGYDFKGIYGNL